MIQESGIDFIGTFEPITLALIVGSAVLLILTVPLIVDMRSGTSRLRNSMIERHTAKLKADARRRVRGSAWQNSGGPLARLTSLLALLPNHVRIEKQKLLRSAGFVDHRSVIVFWSVKAFFLVATLVFILLYLAFSMSSASEFKGLIFLGAFAALGYFGPDFFVSRQRVVRLKRIERGLPDGLDLLVICAEAGLSLDAALKRVADEFVSMVPELSEELLLTSVELNFLPDRRQALLNLSQRVDVPSLRGVTATLIQTEKYGTPLAQALRTLSSEFRENRLLKAEEKAARLPAILTVPMIVFILPALFIVLAAPAFIKVAEKVGN